MSDECNGTKENNGKLCGIQINQFKCRFLYLGIKQVIISNRLTFDFANN